MSMPPPQPFVRRNRHTQSRQTQDDIQTQQQSTRPGPVRRASRDTDAVHTDEYTGYTDADYDDQAVITLQPQRDKRASESRKTRPQRSQSVRPTSAPKKRNTVQKQKQGFNIHWLLLFGIGMLLMLGLYVGGYQLWNSARNVYNDWTYGTTRTYQLDAVVGDRDSASAPTHFIATNLRGVVDIIEFPGGDITRAKVYSGPRLLWNQADKAVVTLEVKDVNGDRKPDVIVHIFGNTTMLFQQNTLNFVLINTGAGFKPLSPLP